MKDTFPTLADFKENKIVIRLLPCDNEVRRQYTKVHKIPHYTPNCPLCKIGIPLIGNKNGSKTSN